MSESQTAIDLRLIDEMCDEIERHGVPVLVGGMSRYVRTERGKRAARMIERLARELCSEKWARKMDQQSAQRTLEAQQANLNSEREMNHQLTTELQRLQEKRA